MAEGHGFACQLLPFSLGCVESTHEIHNSIRVTYFRVLKQHGSFCCAVAVQIEVLSC